MRRTSRAGVRDIYGNAPLLATLETGTVAAPDWLERVDLGGPQEFAVYRVAD